MQVPSAHRTQPLYHDLAFYIMFEYIARRGFIVRVYMYKTLPGQLINAVDQVPAADSGHFLNHIRTEFSTQDGRRLQQVDRVFLKPVDLIPHQSINGFGGCTFFQPGEFFTVDIRQLHGAQALDQKVRVTACQPLHDGDHFLARGPPHNSLHEQSNLAVLQWVQRNGIQLAHPANALQQGFNVMVFHFRRDCQDQ